MYFKITNAEENHNGFQYVDGLNILKEKFNDDPNQSCCAGGLYFTDAANIIEFISYGIYLREVTLPTNNPDFLMIKDNNKWRANMIILGKRYDLFNVNTFKYLIECGANNHTSSTYFLCWSASNGHLDVIKYLIEKGTDVHAGGDYALRFSANNGHLNVVKYLIENGANVHADDNAALRLSAEYGHLDVVKYLIENGANVHADNDYALRWSAREGYLDVVKYLIENGANVHADNDYALKWSTENGHLLVAKFIVENGNLDIHEYLKSKC